MQKTLGVCFLLAAPIWAIVNPCIKISEEDHKSIMRFSEDTANLAFSDECSIGLPSLHSFISIRLPTSVLPITPSCIDTKYIQCKLGKLSCSKKEKKQAKAIFIDMGCNVFGDLVAEEAQTEDCIRKAATAALKVAVTNLLDQDNIEKHQRERIQARVEGKTEPPKPPSNYLRKFDKVIEQSVEDIYMPWYRYAERPYISTSAAEAVRDADSLSALPKKYNSVAGTVGGSWSQTEVKNLIDSRDLVKPKEWKVNFKLALKKILKSFTTYPAVNCIKTNNSPTSIVATSCSPGYAQSFGFPWREERTVKGNSICGAHYGRMRPIQAHPIFIREAILDIIPTFSTDHGYRNGTINYFKTFAKSWIWSDLPSECASPTSLATCWVFSSCVRLLAEKKMTAYLQQEHEED